MRYLNFCSPYCYRRTLCNKTLSQKHPSCFFLSLAPEATTIFWGAVGQRRLTVLVPELNIKKITQHVMFCIKLPSIRITYCNSFMLLQISRICYFLLLSSISYKYIPQFIFHLPTDRYFIGVQFYNYYK